MLPQSYRQAYQVFLTELVQINNLVAGNDFDGNLLQKSWYQAEQVFLKQILPLTGDELDGAILPRWQSLHTEMYRTWRLLGTEVMFVKASRQLATGKQRLTSFIHRLGQLINYCELLLDCHK